MDFQKMEVGGPTLMTETVLAFLVYGILICLFRKHNDGYRSIHLKAL